jgi:hypothetical protein
MAGLFFALATCAGSSMSGTAPLLGLVNSDDDDVDDLYVPPPAVFLDAPLSFSQWTYHSEHAADARKS